MRVGFFCLFKKAGFQTFFIYLVAPCSMWDVSAPTGIEPELLWPFFFFFPLSSVTQLIAKPLFKIPIPSFSLTVLLNCREVQEIFVKPHSSAQVHECLPLVLPVEPWLPSF